MSEPEQRSRRRTVRYEWSGDQIKALRQHMGLTQREMADELEVRQQTISEWETEMHRPHRSTQKVLTVIAERAGFQYQVSASATDGSEPPIEA
jgi:DNA-binding transcriptional regulator YiaG